MTRYTNPGLADADSKTLAWDPGIYNLKKVSDGSSDEVR